MYDLPPIERPACIGAPTFLGCVAPSCAEGSTLPDESRKGHVEEPMNRTDSENGLHVLSPIASQCDRPRVIGPPAKTLSSLNKDNSAVGILDPWACFWAMIRRITDVPHAPVANTVREDDGWPVNPEVIRAPQYSIDAVVDSRNRSTSVQAVLVPFPQAVRADDGRQVDSVTITVLEPFLGAILPPQRRPTCAMYCPAVKPRLEPLFPAQRAGRAQTHRTSVPIFLRGHSRMAARECGTVAAVP